jgi:hypothetical protein
VRPVNRIGRELLDAAAFRLNLIPMGMVLIV